MKRRICVVITARPSYSRIKSVLTAIQSHSDLELQLVVGASALLHNYGNTATQIQRDGFDLTARVYMVVEGQNLTTMAKGTGLGVIELATAFDNIKPGAVVTIADRYETLATAIAASYMNIPLVHVQGGEITGSIDEKVRHSVTKLADLHFVSTAKAKERVIRMGESPPTVFQTGCPSIDLAAEIMRSPELDFDPYSRYGGVGAKLDLSSGYLVVMQHPVTTEYDQARAHVQETLHAVKKLDLPVLWFWPNVDAGSNATSEGIRNFREQEGSEHVHFFKSMEPRDFLRLLYSSKGIVGNSSVAIRECSFLGVPAVNIGTRQSGRERGRNVIEVDYDREQIEAAIDTGLRNGKCPSDQLYGDGCAGPRIADLLAQQTLRTEKRLAY